MRPALRPQPAQEAPPPDEGLLTHAVYLQATTPVDATLPVSEKVFSAIASCLGYQRPPKLLCTSSIAQGVAAKSALLLAWHPTRQRLLTASTAAAVEYDAVSGARRNLVEVTGTPLRVCYTSSGGAVVLLTKVRAWEGRPQARVSVGSASTCCTSQCMLRTLRRLCCTP